MITRYSLISVYVFFLFSLPRAAGMCVNRSLTVTTRRKLVTSADAHLGDVVILEIHMEVKISDRLIGILITGDDPPVGHSHVYPKHGHAAHMHIRTHANARTHTNPRHAHWRTLPLPSATRFTLADAPQRCQPPASGTCDSPAQRCQRCI